MFPFGYGLSYTTFEYSNLEVEELGPMSYKVSVDVTNTGKEAGAEVVQLYVHCAASKLFRAEKELKGFGKLYLKPGECKKLTMTLDQRSFAYYNTKAKDWCVEGGSYDLLMRASSADIRLKASLTLTGDGKEILLTEQYQKLSDYIRPSYPLRISNEQFISLLGYTPKDDHFGKPYDRNSNLTDIKDTLIGKILCSVVKKSIRKMSGGASAPDPTTTLMMERSVMEMPLRSMKMATGLTNHKIDGIVELANGHFFRGIRMLLSK
jgi:beta-glucosidase